MAWPFNDINDKKNYRYVLTCFIAVDQTPNLETIMLRNG